MNRIALQLFLALLAGGAIAASAVTISVPQLAQHSPERPPSLERHAPPLSTMHGPVLVQLFRGRVHASHQEISITTIFREKSFTMLADAGTAGGSEEDLKTHVREIFSLQEVISLGSSIVMLSGGSALLDDNGRQLEIRVKGQPVGDRAVRLEVSAARDGEEVVSTSVIARLGRRIVLVGPHLLVPGGGRDDREISFICLTPLD